MRNKLSVLIIFMAVVIQGCIYSGSATKTTFTALALQKESFYTAMEVAGDMHKQGMISDVTAHSLIKQSRVFLESYKIAVNILYTYKNGQINDFDFEIQMGNYKKILKSFTGVVEAIIDGYQPRPE